MAEIESLELQITSDAKGAKDGLDALIATLDTLKMKTKGGCGLTTVANQVSKMATAAGKLNGSEGAKLESLAKGLKALSGLGNLKLSSSIANQLSAMGDAVKNLDGADFSKVKDLGNSLQSLETLGKSNLGSTLNQIKKIPEVMTELSKVDMAAFKVKIQEVTEALKPFADEMQKVANGFSAFPDKIQKFLSASSKVPDSNAKSSDSFRVLATKVGVGIYALKRGMRVIASWVNESNEYTENLNLFTVSMGKYAESAMEYANAVSEVMGINPSDWIRNQGVFMTLATGFGSVGDRAATMSEQLTQLGYDLASYYNITVEEAMQKLKSGFAGELEPLRNLGYDLSQAKLEAVALSLGIDKAVSSMTQAEKAELRYYAIMNQVTQVQGDMARTLTDPANQLRVLRAQLEMTAKSLGDIFIPMLKAVLPVVIAVVKVIRFLADTIAGLVGGEKSESGLGNLETSAGGASDAIEEATGNAKKLRKTLLGIDELNVMSDPSSSGSGADDLGGGGFDFELPTYDFIGEAVDDQVNQIVEKMKEWLGITGEINSWSDLLNSKLGIILGVVGAIGAAFAAWKIYEVGGSVSAVFGEITTALTGAQTAITTATGLSLGAIASIVAALIGVVAGLTAVYLTNEDVRTSVDNAVASIGESLVPLFEFMTGTVIPDLLGAWDALMAILQPLGDWIVMVFTSVWQDMLIPVLEWISSSVVPGLIECFEVFWNNVLVPLGSFIGSVLTPVVEILSDVLTWLWKYIVVPMADYLASVFAAAWEGITEIFAYTVVPILNVVISLFQYMWNALLPIVNFLWDVFAPAFEEVFKGVADIIEACKDIWVGLINFVTGVFTLNWKKAWSGLVQLFGGIFSGIGALVKTPINAVLAVIESFINKIIDGWNWLKRQINSLSIDIPDWLGGGTLGFNLAMSSYVSLPRFADGGFPAQGQMFVAREAGPELVGSIGNRSAVVNNDQIVDSVSRGVYQAVVAAMGSRGDQVVEAKVNDKVLFEVLVSRARQETVRTGYNPLLGGV